ncbi:MAG: hypothetical protein LBJ84_01255 [Oscillospiraceae bacterium]|jgi:hypothetical protein|nr:hypothetical protein [Oscillospiraceae bacterium]
MANFDEFKEKAKATIGAIADVSVELYKAAGEKAKILAKITMLTAEIARERSAIRRLYGEIGSKYYEMHKFDAESELAQKTAAVTEAYGVISDRQTEIDLLRSSGDITQAEYEEAERDADVESAAGGEGADGGPESDS